MQEKTVNILGDELPSGMFKYFVSMISADIKGFKYSYASQDFECPFCHYGNTIPVVETDCGHIYHIECLEKWKKVINNCSMCRNILPSCNKIIQELLFRLKENIKIQILKSWRDKLHVLSNKEIYVDIHQIPCADPSESWNIVNMSVD